MKNTVSQKTINIIKATAPVIKQHGKKITSRMYEIMFDKYPEVKSQFDMSAQANGKQPTKLANAIYSYATHIEDMASLQKMVDKVAHRHVQTHVLPKIMGLKPRPKGSNVQVLNLHISRFLNII